MGVVMFWQKGVLGERQMMQAGAGTAERRRSGVAAERETVFVRPFLPMRLPQFFATILLMIPMLPGCSGAGRLLKAGKVEPSPFFEQPWLAQDGGTQLPFHKVWTTLEPQVLAAGMKRRKLYIAAVTLAYLRPVRKALATQEMAWGVQRQEAQVAQRLR